MGAGIASDTCGFTRAVRYLNVHSEGPAHQPQSCQLIPCFGEGDVPAEWRSEMVLDQCDRFWLNNWATLKYAYQSLY